MNLVFGIVFAVIAAAVSAVLLGLGQSILALREIAINTRALLPPQYEPPKEMYAGAFTAARALRIASIAVNVVGLLAFLRGFVTG